MGIVTVLGGLLRFESGMTPDSRLMTIRWILAPPISVLALYVDWLIWIQPASDQPSGLVRSAVVDDVAVLD
jgi:hypothetical protein